MHWHRDGDVGVSRRPPPLPVMGVGGEGAAIAVVRAFRVLLHLLHAKDIQTYLHLEILNIKI